MNTQSHFNIFEELQEWSKSLESWQRLALLNLIQNSELDNETETQIYKEFKLDKGVLESEETRQDYKLNASSVPQKPEKEEPLVLMKLSDVKGVNAIVEGQKLRFGPKLTVIYGPNGSGKSGYARILKAACFTRSEDIKIHGNVHIPPEDRFNPSALITFENSTQVSFQEGTPCPQMRDNFAVFDSSCVRVYTDSKNDFNVTPYGFDVFPGLVSVFDKIRELLKDEIAQRTPNLDDFKIPDSTSGVAMFLNNISSESDINKLDELKEFGTEDEATLNYISKQLEELKRKDPAELINRKRVQGRDMKYLIGDIRSLSSTLSLKTGQDIKNRIKALIELREVVSVASVSQFKNEPVQPIGTEIWRKLIEAAIEYNQQVFPGAKFPAEVDKSRCLLCHQILQGDSPQRLARFYEFINSDAEQKIKIAVKEILAVKLALKKLSLEFFNDKSSVYRSVTDYDNKVTEKLVHYISGLKSLRTILIDNIENEKWTEISEIESIPEDSLVNIRKQLATDIRLFRKGNVSQQIKELSEELQLLKDRKQLNLIFVKVKTAIENLNWMKKADVVSKTFKQSQRYVTDEQKSMTEDLIARGFKEQFRTECENLDYKLPLEIKISGTDAVTHRKLSIGSVSKLSPHPSKILSEGEQTAVALADFLTEIRLNNRPLGIIFDDPVNSLDHMRKEKIAKRLVEEACKRQVIVFTHDILFTHHLAEEAQKVGSDKVKFMACTISSDTGTPGYVNKSVFPHMHYEKGAAKQSEEYLEQAKKLTEVEQKEKLELGCGSLRAAYEDFIQRDLFNDVVARWREPIKATALSRMYFDENIIKDIVEHYELLSRFEKGHSHTAEFHEKPLDCAFLDTEIKAFKDMRSRYRKDKEKYSDQKSNEKKDVFTS